MLEWIISSAVLIAIVIVLRLILKGKMSLRLQYALWAIVLLRLLIPFSFGSTAWSVQNLVERAAETPKVTYTEMKDAQTGLPAAVVAISGFTPEETDAQNIGIDIQAEPAENQYVREGLRIEVTPAGEPSLAVNEILNIVWTAGAGLIALWLLVTNLRFYFKLRKSRELLEVDGATLPVYVTDQIDTPCLFGLIKPKIYVTPDAAADETVLRYSVEHEATHRRHGDHLWSLLRGLCLAVHWFNPLVWIAAVLSRNDAELACDEATIRRIGEEHRADYGRTLLQLTCEKRPAIFVAATTMTGSGRTIKERIKLIVKKPKTAIITLIAIVLVIAIAVGCTFTGAKPEEPDTDTERASLDASDIHALLDAFDLNEATLTLSGAKVAPVPAGAAICAEDYLAELKQYTWENYPFSIDETYAADSYIQLAVPHTTFTFYGDGLHTDYLVRVETDEGEGWFRPPVKEDDATWSEKSAYREIYLWVQEAEGAILFGGEGRLLTAEELEFFRDYTLSQSIFFTSSYSDVRDMDAWLFLRHFNGERFEPQNEAERQLLTEIKLYDGNTRDYSSPEGEPAMRIARADVDAYLMQYAGVTVADMHTNWFEKVSYLPETDCFYIGAAYFGPVIFNPVVGVQNGSTVTLGRRNVLLDAPREYWPFDRLTLEKNGDGWRILSFISEDPLWEIAATEPTVLTEMTVGLSEPEELPADLAAAVEGLCESGDVSLTLFFADSGEWGTYTGDGYTMNSLPVRIAAYNWTRLDAPTTEPSDYWLTAVSADGTKRMTFWEDDGAGTVEYSDGTASIFWKAAQVYPGALSVAESVREQFDRLETNFSRVSFRVDGTAEDAAEYFARTAVGEHMQSLEPGNGFGADDYEVIEWRVIEVSEDGKTVKGAFSCSFVPRHPESVDIRAGNTREGTGRYAGKLIFDRTFVLRLQDDGCWHCAEFGTG